MIEKETAGAKASPKPPEPIFAKLVFLYAITIGAQLISLAFGRIDAEKSFSSIVLPSVVALSVVSLPLIWAGLSLGPSVGLETPHFNVLISKKPGAWRKLWRDTLIASGFGLLLGVVLLQLRGITAPYLPAEVPSFGHRGFIGGLAVSIGAAVAEEVWFRLGLMTILVWCLSKLVREKKAGPALMWSVIIITSIGFGMAHLPQLISYGASSPFAIGGTILGNTLVGTLYGWCFWRRSLVAAMIAHFAVDIVLHALPALFQ